MSIRLKLMLLICLLFFTAIGNALFIYTLESFQEEKLFWVDHTNDVLHNSTDFLSSLKDTETGQRGYLLTNTSSYLQPYYTGLSNAAAHYKELLRLTVDNPAQQERLISIQELMDLKLDELAETISLAQQEQGNSAALSVVINNKGKEYMDNIRALLNDFENAEALLLEQRKGDYRESKAIIDTLITVELIFFVFLAIFTFFFLQKSFSNHWTCC